MSFSRARACALNFAAKRPSDRWRISSRSFNTLTEVLALQYVRTLGIRSTISTMRSPILRIHSYWYPSTSTGVGAFGFSDAFPKTIDMTPFVNKYAGQIDPNWNNLPASKCFNMPFYVPTTFDRFPFSVLKDAISAHPETHGYLRAIPLPAIWNGYKAIRSSLYPSLPDPDPAPAP